MKLRISIDIDAKEDIQKGINWYNSNNKRLGNKFHQALKTSFKNLQTNPYYQIRYNKTHCLPLKKFPYMIHFTIDKEAKTVIIRAVFHTSQNPDLWKDR